MFHKQGLQKVHPDKESSLVAGIVHMSACCAHRSQCERPARGKIISGTEPVDLMQPTARTTQS